MSIFSALFFVDVKNSSHQIVLSILIKLNTVSGTKPVPIYLHFWPCRHSKLYVFGHAYIVGILILFLSGWTRSPARTMAWRSHGTDNADLVANLFRHDVFISCQWRKEEKSTGTFRTFPRIFGCLHNIRSTIPIINVV